MLEIESLPRKKDFNSIAVLTSGGDAPGMNAAVRAIVRYGIDQDCKVHGIQRGYSGLLEGDIHEMNLSSVANIIQRGGTILKTSRCKSFHRKETRKEASNLLKRNKIDALVVIGGDGSFTGAHLMQKETGFPVIGIPGTIDNDIIGTEDTIGFDTAVNSALEAIDRIRDTASSHDRLFLIEVMGRSTGFIAAHVGMGGGADTIIVPEKKSGVDTIIQNFERGLNRGKTSSIVVIAEGPKEGLSHSLARELQEKGHPARVCILGHIQRGGSPTAHDRFLASTLGAAAVEHLLGGHSDCMIGVQSNQVKKVPFSKVFGKKKDFSKEWLRLADILGK